MKEGLNKCYRCESEKIVKNGHTKDGKQKYLCKDCYSILTVNVKKNLTKKEMKEIKMLLEIDCEIEEIAKKYNKTKRTIDAILK